MKNILITGGAGNIGSSLAKALILEPDYFVTIFDNLSTGSLDNLPNQKNNNWEFIEGDVYYFCPEHAIGLHIRSIAHDRSIIKSLVECMQSIAEPIHFCYAMGGYLANGKMPPKKILDKYLTIKEEDHEVLDGAIFPRLPDKITIPLRRYHLSLDPKFDTMYDKFFWSSDSKCLVAIHTSEMKDR